MNVKFDDQFDDWVENVLVRFLFGFRVEVEKSSIFHEYCKIKYQGRGGPGICWEQRRKSLREGNANFKFFREIWRKIHISQEDFT